MTSNTKVSTTRLSSSSATLGYGVVGELVGAGVCATVGLAVGAEEGLAVGEGVGADVGAAVGAGVGAEEGLDVGEGVGAPINIAPEVRVLEPREIVYLVPIMQPCDRCHRWVSCI